jgi:TatD DNase family protein
LVDSHCHIAGPEFAGDLEAVVTRARDSGVRQALVILASEDDVELRRAHEVATVWPEVRFSVGVHPHNAGPFAANAADAAQLTSQGIAGQPLARAVGEIGLDYHYDHAPRDVQRKVFAEQIQLAQQRGLPIVIHTREAEEDTFAILTQAGPVPGVFHCFTGDVPMARRALDAGFHVSLSGIVTFPRATELKAVAAFVPGDRLLVETDSPYLAPVPHREPATSPPT